MALSQQKGDAKRYLGKEISCAIVTVPAYFNDAQRRSTRYAGVIAWVVCGNGLLMNPWPAAIAYGMKEAIWIEGEG